jgi:PqqD family protein of HPr-rel-A system
MNTWSRAAHERFRIRSWSGDEGVVFDTLSGDTHLLESLALELLHCLDAAAPRDARALLDDLADSVGDDGLESALHAVERSLESMQRVGLVVAYPD